MENDTLAHQHTDLLIASLRRTIDGLREGLRAAEMLADSRGEDLQILSVLYRTTVHFAADREKEAQEFRRKYYDLLNRTREQRRAA
jgi:hypothetical protein